ncbi:MAG: hypothetical protein JF626_14890 [Polaromonas sp.]|nr:hypothetical protein [Polaromonas sp.]
MIRRLASLLVVMLGLISVSVPASACAALMSERHCCGGEQPPPCGECPAPAQPDPGTCASAPAAIIAAPALMHVEAPAPVGTVGPPPAHDAFVAGVLPTSRAQSPARASPARVAASIYLVTARLRL